MRTCFAPKHRQIFSTHSSPDSQCSFLSHGRLMTMGTVDISWQPPGIRHSQIWFTHIASGRHLDVSEDWSQRSPISWYSVRHWPPTSIIPLRQWQTPSRQTPSPPLHLSAPGQQDIDFSIGARFARSFWAKQPSPRHLHLPLIFTRGRRHFRVLGGFRESFCMLASTWIRLLVSSSEVAMLAFLEGFLPKFDD